MNWKRRIDIGAAIIATLLSLVTVSRAFAGRLITQRDSHLLAQRASGGELTSAVLEWRVSRDFAWNRKMRALGTYEQQLTSKLLPAQVSSVPLPARVAGQFASGDWVVKDSYADVYQFDGRAGEAVKLEARTVRGLDLDTYLLLLDPYQRPYAENDDWGTINSDSRLEVTLPQGGVWTVVVLSLEPQDDGDYALTLSRPDIL